MERSRSASWALGWLAAVLVFWIGLFVASMQPGTRRPMDVDLYGYFFPKFWYGNAELDAGRLPLWNPYEFTGLPFLATAQAAALYPLKILAFDLVPWAPLHAYMVLHYFLAGVFAFAALRGLGLGPAGAALGTVTWVFSGINLDSHYHPNRLSCLTWIPLVFLCFTRLLAWPGPRPAAGLALATTMLLLAGYPEYVLDTAVCVLAFWPGAALALGREAGPPRGRLRWLVASGLLVAALGALQMLPTAEMARESTRASGPVAPGSEALSLVQFAFPTLGEKIAAGVALFTRTLPMAPAAWLLVPVGVFLSRARFRPAFTAVLGLTLLLASPIRLVLGDLPVFSWLRPNYCWISLTYLPLAYLAGAGLEVVAGETAPARARRLPRLLMIAVLALGSLPFIGLRAWPLLAAALALLVAARLRPGWRGPCLAGVVGAVALALWAWNPPAVTTPVLHRFARGEAPYPEAPPRGRDLDDAVVALCADWPVRLLAPWLVWTGEPLLERVEVLQGYPEPLVPRRVHTLLTAVGASPDQALGTKFTGFAAAPQVLDLLNVGCVLAPPHGDPAVPGLGLARAGETPADSVWRRPHPPRGVLVDRVMAVDGEEAALAAVRRPGFDPRHQVVLETDAPPTPVPGATGTARVVWDVPGEVRLQVTASAPAVLVVSQASYPGWRARVDGAPAPLYRANYAVTALAVPDGEHEVELRYRPLSARLGWWLLVAGLAGLVVLAAWPEPRPDP